MSKRMVIKGSEWRRGGGSNALRNLDGTYCCPGLHGRLCGVRDKDMTNVLWPHQVESHPVFRQAWGEEYLTAGRINDDREIDDDERVEKLRPLFRAVGVTLVWRPDL